MFLIKGYYLIFWVFIHTIVGLCEMVNWIKHPRQNIILPLGQSRLQTLTSLFQLSSKNDKDRPSQWRHRPIPAYIK